MRNHFIVCGFGRMGRVLCRELAARPVPFVVVEHQSKLAADLAALNYRFVMGDATDDEILRQSGLEHARGLVTVLGSDAVNVFITLTARRQNPGIFILARCAEERSMDKLRAAGADRVMNPYTRGGVQMAQVLLRPAVVDFIDEVSRDTGLSLVMEEVSVDAGSTLAGMSLRDSPIRSELNAIVVAIQKTGGEKTFNPTPEQLIDEGDVLIVLGGRSGLDRLATLARGGATGEGGCA
jgi:voltage-gated potassium channel